MLKRITLLLLLAVASADAAQTVKLAVGVPFPAVAKGVAVANADGTITFTLDPNSEITITGPGGGPTPPGPVVPPPSGTLSDAVKAATAAVPEYSGKDDHRRAMAFGMTFLSQATANTPVANARATVRQFCDSAVGADKDKWAAWWATVDAKLNSMNLTPATYTTALGEISNALTATIAVSSEKYGSTPTYGLSPEIIKLLLEVLLPLLLKLLKLQ